MCGSLSCGVFLCISCIVESSIIFIKVYLVSFLVILTSLSIILTDQGFDVQVFSTRFWALARDVQDSL